MSAIRERQNYDQPIQIWERLPIWAELGLTTEERAGRLALTAEVDSSEPNPIVTEPDPIIEHPYEVLEAMGNSRLPS